MLIIPGIDLKDGKSVRLRQGRMEDDTVFSDDPVDCLLYTSPSPRDGLLSRMPSSA